MIYLLFIPLGLLVVPWLLVRFVFATEQTRGLAYKTHAPYLVAACALWLAAMFLPNIPVSPETNSFTMHFCGGLVAGVLYLYTLKVYNLQFAHTWQFWVGLYLVVSGLGVLNELFEFVADKTGVIPLPSYVTTRDPWWDLLANTLGGFVLVGAVRIVQLLRKK